MKHKPSHDLVLTEPAAGASGSPDIAARIGSAILGFLGDVPRTNEKRSTQPAESARQIAARAAAKAATAAGTLALPIGPLGWLTVLPEMVAVWRVQAAMVSDIAAVYGRHGSLTREQMIFCLFKHTASQAVRDLVVRTGERWLVRKATMTGLRSIARRIGAKLSERVVTKGVTRWMPVVGALGVAAYAYYDTAQVAKAAIALFERDIDVIDAEE